MADTPEKMFVRFNDYAPSIDAASIRKWSTSKFDGGTEYTRKDLSDARIAELEDVNKNLQAQKLRLIETQPDLAAELATARNDALSNATVKELREALQKAITASIRARGYSEEMQNGH